MMQTVQSVLLVIQVLVAVCLIGLILIQHGKGADAGAAFGSGASATVFGARGSANFFSRATAVLAIVFLANSLALSYMATQRIRSEGSIMSTSMPGSVIPGGTAKPAQKPAVPAELPPAKPGSDAPAVPAN